MALVVPRLVFPTTATMSPTVAGVFQWFMSTIRPDDLYDYNADLVRYAMSNPYTDVVLIGMSSPARVRQNIALAEMPKFDMKDIHKKFY